MIGWTGIRILRKEWAEIENEYWKWIADKLHKKTVFQKIKQLVNKKLKEKYNGKA